MTPAPRAPAATCSAATTRCSAAGRPRRSRGCAGCRTHLDPRQRRSLGGRASRRRAGAQRRRGVPRAGRRGSGRRAGRAAAERRPRARHARMARLAEERPALLLATARRRRGRAARGGHRSAPRFRPLPLSFERTAAGGIGLVGPGSVGMPFDGDHRAAYALLHPRRAHRAPPRRLRPRRQRRARARRGEARRGARSSPRASSARDGLATRLYSLTRSMRIERRTTRAPLVEVVAAGSPVDTTSTALMLRSVT